MAISQIVTNSIATGAVDAADLANASVTTAKLANASVTVAKISATGTPSASTILKGDGSWGTLEGGVTSLNGQTGAITNTSLYAIGSYVTGRPGNNTNYAANSTIAGSSLYAAPGGTEWVSGSSFFFYSSNFSSTWTITAVTVGTGTWRCVTAANGTGSQNIVGLWVRIS